ncbi:hypothetical protein PMIN07_010267 [Paraphaeosphaeria minitans]
MRGLGFNGVPYCILSVVFLLAYPTIPSLLDTYPLGSPKCPPSTNLTTRQVHRSQPYLDILGIKEFEWLAATLLSLQNKHQTLPLWHLSSFDPSLYVFTIVEMPLHNLRGPLI